MKTTEAVQVVQDAVTKLRGLFEDDDKDALDCAWAAESSLSELLEVVGGREEEPRRSDSGRGWDADRWSGLDRTDEEVEALDVALTSPECDFEVTWKPEALRQIREGGAS